MTEDDDYEEELCGCGDDECPQCGGDCWECGGEGWGIIGDDISARDIDLGRDGEIENCRNCGGTGTAKDCTYW